MTKIMLNDFIKRSILISVFFIVVFCGGDGVRDFQDFTRAYHCITCDRPLINITELSYNSLIVDKFGNEVNINPTVTPANYTDVRSIFTLSVQKDGASSNLPAGLYFNSHTGSVTGQAFETGTYTLNFGIEGAFGSSGSAESTITLTIPSIIVGTNTITQIRYTNNNQILDVRKIIGNADGYLTNSFPILSMTPVFGSTPENAPIYAYQVTAESMTKYTESGLILDPATGVISGNLPTTRPVDMEPNLAQGAITDPAGWSFSVDVCNGAACNMNNDNVIATISVNIYASYRWTPVNDAENVPINHLVTFFFPRDMNTVQLNKLAVFDPTNTQVPAKIIREHRLLTIKFDENLNQNTRYQIRNSDSILSSFTTASGDSPRDYLRGVEVSTPNQETYTAGVIRLLASGLNALLGAEDGFDADIFESAILRLRQLYAPKVTSMIYTSVDVNGSLDQVSGLYSYPSEDSIFRENEESGVLVFHHGTTFTHSSAPSASVLPCTRFDVSGEDCSLLDGDFPILARLNTFFASALSSDGAVTILPDIQGLGEISRDETHLYINSYVAADNGIDMVRAVRASLPEQIRTRLTPYTTIIGYSEGGLFAASHTRVSEMRYYDETNNLTDLSYLGAGPYDMVAALRRFYLPESLEGRGTLTYFAYIYAAIEGFNDTYNTKVTSGSSDLTNTDALFLLATDEQVKQQDGPYYIDLADALLEETPIQFNETFAENYLESTDGITDSFILDDILRINSVEYWQPRTGIRLFHAKNDPQVPTFVARIAYKNYILNNDYNKDNITIDDSLCDQESVAKIRNSMGIVTNYGQENDPHSNCFIHFLSDFLETHLLQTTE